jgi:hypothetical protein
VLSTSRWTQLSAQSGRRSFETYFQNQ